MNNIPYHAVPIGVTRDNLKGYGLFLDRHGIEILLVKTQVGNLVFTKSSWSRYD